MKCITCSGKQKEIFTYKGHHYYRCNSCGLVSTYPYPDKQQIIKHYKKKFEKGNYQLLQTYSSDYKKVYEEFASILEQEMRKNNKNLNKKMKVLDIGCFTGEFLEILLRKGVDVYGLELQKEAVEIANKRLHGKVKRADVMTAPFPKEKFDAITLFGLIEHVTNPAKLIAQCYKLLKKDGIIMIQTPNSSSLFALIMQKYWPPYAPVEHIHLFSRKSLEILLHKNNFSQITFSQSWKNLPVGYVYHMLDNFGPEFRLFFKPFNFFLSMFGIKSLPFYVGEMIIIAKK